MQKTFSKSANALVLLIAIISLRGAYSGFYAYPFIDSRNLVYGRVFQNIAALMVVFVLPGFIFFSWTGS